MHYFFYGTLCDPDIRERVLGYRPGPRQLRPAWLSGFRRKQARGQSYPVLIRAPGSRVDGLLFAARPADRALLAAYEGAEYRSCRLPVRQGRMSVSANPRRAVVFLPAVGPQGCALPAGYADWTLGRWRRRDKVTFLPSVSSRIESCVRPST